MWNFASFQLMGVVFVFNCLGVNIFVLSSKPDLSTNLQTFEFCRHLSKQHILLMGPCEGT